MGCLAAQSWIGRQGAVMAVAKKRKTRPAKKKRPPPKRKPQIVVMTEEPTNIIQATLPRSSPAKRAVWDTVASIRHSLWFGFWIGVCLSPIGAHIISQFYCGTGDNARCVPIEFPAWLEGGGIFFALVLANAARDVVSKSARQMLDSLKGAGALLSRARSGNTTEQVSAKPGGD